MRRLVPVCLLTIGLATTALLLAGGNATGTQLLTNPGFEDGTNGWTPDDATFGTSTNSLDGNYAGELTSANGNPARVHQTVPVEAGRSYAFSGWVLAKDPDIFYAWLRITWFDGLGSQLIATDSPQLVGAFNDFRYLTVEAPAPANAESARAALHVSAFGGYSILIDDMALEEGPAPPTTQPATTPPTESAAPTAQGTSTPTATATQAPPTASPSPSPRPPQPTPDEPRVFPILTNGGFEELRGDDTPYGWRKIGGTLASADSPVSSGPRSLLLTSDGTASTKWAYQGVAVSAGRYYEAAAVASVSDDDVDAVFLRISWYESDDTSGEAIGNEDSLEALGPGSDGWRSLSTGPVQAPEEARSARVRLMLRPSGERAATAYFDSVHFDEVAAPTDAPNTPTPAASQTPEVTATAAPTSTSDPTRTAMATATSTHAPTPSSTATPSPAPTPTAVPEPKVFPELTNGGFEISRDDGTPYAWSRTGGEIAVSDSAAMDGALGLEMVSRTTATKWAYQTVSVEPGAFYEASAWAMGGMGVDSAVVRVSWYSSATGDGQALASDDSGALASADGVFHYLTTEAIQAPADAHSAKVRLLVRPASGATAIAGFDSVAFGRVEAPQPEAAPQATATRTPAPGRGSSSGGSSVQQVSDVSNTDGDTPEREVPSLANVRPAPVVLAASQSPTPDGDGGVSVRDVVIGLLIGVPLLGIGGIFAQDIAAQPKRGK